MPKIKDLGIKVIPEPMRPPEIGGGGGGCTDCTVQPFSICGGTHGCTDCTLQPFSIARCWGYTCRCTFNHWESWLWTPGDPYRACGPLSLPCGAYTGCGAISPVCGGSMVNPPGDPGLTKQQIAKLKEQLQQQIDALDEHAKTLEKRKK